MHGFMKGDIFDHFIAQAVKAHHKQICALSTKIEALTCQLQLATSENSHEGDIGPIPNERIGLHAQRAGELLSTDWGPTQWPTASERSDTAGASWSPIQWPIASERCEPAGESSFSKPPSPASGSPSGIDLEFVQELVNPDPKAATWTAVNSADATSATKSATWSDFEGIHGASERMNSICEGSVLEGSPDDCWENAPDGAANALPHRQSGDVLSHKFLSEGEKEFMKELMSPKWGKILNKQLHTKIDMNLRYTKALWKRGQLKKRPQIQRYSQASTSSSHTGRSSLHTGFSSRRSKEQESLAGRKQSASSGRDSLISASWSARYLRDRMSEVLSRNPVKRKIWNVVEDRDSGPAGALYDYARRCFYAVSFFLACMKVAELPGSQGLAFMRRGETSSMVCDLVIEACFLLELLVRLYVCPQRVLFWFNAYNIIDLLSTLPLMLRIRLLTADDRSMSDSKTVISLLGVVAVLRLLRSLRRFENVQLLMKAYMEAAAALPVVLFSLSLIVLSFTVAIYYFESPHNIETFPMAFYLVIVTLGTVGYGDIHPTTVGGRIFATLLIIVGPLYMAIPIGIVGTSFSQAWEDRHRLLLMSRLRERVANAGFKPNDVKHMFEHVKQGKDDWASLDYREFREIVDLMELDVKEEYVQLVFDTMDLDSGGSLDVDELLQGFFPDAYLRLYDHTSKIVQSVSELPRPSMAPWSHQHGSNQ